MNDEQMDDLNYVDFATAFENLRLATRLGERLRQLNLFSLS